MALFAPYFQSFAGMRLPAFAVHLNEKYSPLEPDHP
jgi:hypothetical protein